MKLFARLFFLIAVILMPCSIRAAEEITAGNATFDQPFVQIDPYGMNPLSALISFKTEKPSQVHLVIKGRNEAENIEHTFTEYKTEHEIPVLGLYPDYNNTVVLYALTADQSVSTKKISIPIPKVNRRALFVRQHKNDKKTRYYFVSDGIVFDEDGYLRFSFNNRGNIVYSFNGELILENRVGGLIRYSLLGKELQKYPYPAGFTSFTHGMGQKPNGNFLVIGSFIGTTISADGMDVPSHRDFIIELDYQTGQMVNKIDLAAIMNPHRTVIVPKNYIDYGLNDWCHINGVDYDVSDNHIVVSCRHSGLIKLNEKTHELVWIISPNKGFETSGRQGIGPSIQDKVLLAVNSNGEPFSPEIQAGGFSGSSFKWPTQNHNVKVYPNHILTVYDNAGDIYDKKVYSTPNSNALIYLIDEEKKTVQTIWKKALGDHSWAGSSVLYYPKEKEVVVYSASIPDQSQKGTSYGQLTRYDFDTQRVLFSAVIYRGGDGYFYRNDDFQFYPKEN